ILRAPFEIGFRLSACGASSPACPSGCGANLPVCPTQRLPPPPSYSEWTGTGCFRLRCVREMMEGARQFTEDCTRQRDGVPFGAAHAHFLLIVLGRDCTQQKALAVPGPQIAGDGGHVAFR